MAHLGDFDASAVIYGKFTTYRPSTGAPFALAGTPALSVYKDNSTTQSTTGVTLTADFDSVAGLNHFAIDTSADGTFYAAGSCFDIVITTGTVDGVSVVGSVVASFTIRKNSALKPTTAGRTLDVSAGGEAGLDWANIGSPTTTVGLSGTTVKTATDVETDTADIQSRLPAALVSGRIDASVGAVATGAITSGAFAAGAIDAATFAAGAIDAAALAADAGTEIATAVWASAARTLTALDEDSTTLDLDATIRAAVGLASADLDTQLGTLATTSGLATVAAYIDTEVSAILAAVDTEVGSIKATTDKLDGMLENTSDGYIFTTVSLAHVWDETMAAHLTAGSTGQALNAAGAAGDPWTTALPGAYSSGQAGYIVGTNLNATISSRASQTSVDTIDGIVDSILLDTAEIGTAGAGLTALASAANLAVVAGYLDTEISAIKAKTDNLPASPAATGDIPTATQNADALLNRDMSAVSDTNARSPLNALRFLRNKWSISGTTLTVTKENDSTSAWTATVTASPGADPISGNDPT